MANGMKYSDLTVAVLKPVLFLVAFLIILSASSLSASASGEIVKVGVYQYEPVIFLDSEGQAQGFSVDILEAIAVEEGWQIEYVPCTWPEGLEKLENDEIDILPAIAYTEERSEKYDFTNEFLLLDWGQIYTRPDFKIQSITELDKKTVAGLENGIFYLSFKPYAESFGISSDQIEVDSYATVLELLEEKEVDAGVVPRSFNPSKEYDVYQSPIIFAPIEEHFAVPKGKDQEILKAIDEHLVVMKGDRESIYYQSQAKWLESEAEEKISSLFMPLLGIGGGLLFLFIVVSVTLKTQVRRKTAELSDKNDELRLEIAEHKKAQRALRSSEEKYSTLVEKGNDGIVIIQDYVLKFVNSKFTETTGYTKSEAIGRPFINFVSDDFKEVFLEMYNGRLKGDKTTPCKYEVNLVSKNGDDVQVEISASLIDYKGRSADMEIIRDITERKQIEEALKASEGKYSTLVEKGDDGIIIVQDGIIKFANMKMAELVGLSKDGVIGTPFFEYIPPEYRSKAMEKYENNLKASKNIPLKYELELSSEYGLKVPIEINASMIEHEGRPAVMSIIRDITDRKRAEEILRQSEEKFRSIFHSTAAGMAIFSPKGEILEVNPGLCGFLGYSEEEFLEQSAFDSIHPDDRETVFHLFKELVEGKRSYFSFEKRFLCKDGSVLWGLTSAVLLRNSDNEPLYVIGLMQDVTDRKKAEEDLIRSNEFKDLFTDILSHDLLNPAGIIKGFTEILLDMESDEQKFNLIKTIERNNNKLMDLIDNASKLAKLETVDEIEFNRLDICSIMKNVIFDLRPQIDNKKMTVEMGSDGVCYARANPVIEEVFVNLLSNAIKYTPQEGNIVLDVLDDGDFWKITVTDSGDGIDDQNKEKVFERFKRADKGGVKGSGLGLAIVKRIVELHGGSVGVEDNPEGQGSVFWATFKKA